MAGLDPQQLDRYARHVVMDEVGPDGQAALRDATVLVVGAGGLGSPALQYLAAAGVGHLTIVDDDVVERSNLQRQVLHGDADLDRPKVESAREAVTALNPDVSVETHEARLDAELADELVGDHDVVVDAADNFPARYLCTDAGILAGVPVVHGAVYRFEGQVLTVPPEGPCYRCLFPSAPPEDVAPDCAEAGVLGVLPGIVGTLQATEVLKLLLDVGEPLVGRLLAVDAAGARFDPVPIERDPDCAVCGDESTITALQNERYVEACGPSADAAGAE